MENETERAAREQRYAEHDAYVLNFHNEQLTRLRGEAVDALLLAQPHITNPEHAAIEAAQTVDAVFAILTPYYDEQVAHARNKIRTVSDLNRGTIEWRGNKLAEALALIEELKADLGK